MARVDWSGLPLELLHVISKKLPDISDFVRFRAVCKRWMSSVPISDPSPRLPWILLDRCSLEEELNFYSLSSRKIHTILVPESQGKFLYGPSLGYMLTEWSPFLSLLNPLTREELPLPPRQRSRLDRVNVGPNPIQGRQPVVIYRGESLTVELEFCRPGDERWTKVELPCLPYSAETYYNGMYFIHNLQTLATEIFDATSGVFKCAIPPPEWDTSSRIVLHFIYLVESSGELLRVSQLHRSSVTLNQCCFAIHRLEKGEGNYRWVKMRGIGDRILFLDTWYGFSLRANDFVGVKGNCIYFLYNITQQSARKRLCRYDLESGRAEEIPCPSANLWQWFVPSLW